MRRMPHSARRERRKSLTVLLIVRSSARDAGARRSDAAGIRLEQAPPARVQTPPLCKSYKRSIDDAQRVGEQRRVGVGETPRIREQLPEAPTAGHAVIEAQDVA